MAEQSRRDRRNQYDNYDRRRSYNRDREDRQNNNETRPEETQQQANDEKDVLVNIDVNTEKTTKKMDLSDFKIDQLKTQLDEVNGMIVDFYDTLIDELGAQGVLDENGNPMQASNYATPDEKLSALTSVQSIKHSFGINLDKVLEIAKSRKEQLKERAIKILDGEQELIDENNKLIESAKYKIGELKNEKSTLDAKRSEEIRNLDAEERKKDDLVKLCQEIANKIEELKEEVKNPPSDLVQTNNQNQRGRGNQNALSEYIKGLNDQIKYQEGEYANYNNELSNCKTNAQSLMSSIDNLEKQSNNLQDRIDTYNTNLDELINKSGDLTKSHYENIDKLQDYFKENIKGLTVDNTKLNYEKETKVKSADNKDEEKDINNEEQPSNDTQNEQKSQQNGGTVVGNGRVIPNDIANASEQALANYSIENLKHASPAQIRNTLKGRGYSDLVDVLESASQSDKISLNHILANSQEDLGYIDRDEFVSRLSGIFQNEFALDDLYDTIFDDDGNYIDFSTHTDKQINLLREVMDYYNKAMIGQKLTFDQMKIFDDNFAQYAKIGALMERGSRRGGFRGFFRNVFKGKSQAAKNHFLYSLVDYSDAYSGYLANQYSYQSDIRRKLGEQVNPVGSYIQSRVNIDPSSRLARKRDRGEIGKF